MNRNRPLGAITLTLLLAFSALGPASGPAMAAEQWMPPFDPASPTLLSGMKALASTKPGGYMGSGLYPASLDNLNINSEYHLRVVGALASKLPAGFESRLAAALKNPDANEAEIKTLKIELIEAQRSSADQVKEIVQERARQIADLAIKGTNAVGLNATASDFWTFQIYGRAVDQITREVRSMVSEARYDGTMERALESAQRLLRTLPEPIAEDAAVRGAESAKPQVRLGRPTRKPTVLPDDQLNLTPAHYANARKLYSEQFSLRPKIPIEPVLGDSGEKARFRVGDEVKFGTTPA